MTITSPVPARTGPAPARRPASPPHRSGLATRLSLTGSLAVLLGTSALEPVFGTLQWVPRTFGAVGAVALGAALGRRTRLPAVARVVLPLLTLLGFLTLAFVPGSLHLSLATFGDDGVVTAFRRLFEAAGTDLDRYGPPAPATDALVLLAAAGVGLVALVVEVIAGAARRPAPAGLPLLALFAVPSAVLTGGVGWIPFVLTGAGWLALLLVEGREQALRWGTAVRAREGGDLAGLGRVGRRIGGAALVLAVLVPAFLPGLDGRLLDGGEGGGGGGGGSRSVTTYNPITRLRGELTLPEPRDVLRYTTDDPDPDYLRMTTLSVYDGSGWRQEVLRGNLRDDGVDDAIPTPVGVSGTVPSRSVQSRISISSLQAFWLPVPATPRSVDVDGPWMWDPGSQSVFATRARTSDVVDYGVRSSRVLPTADLLTGTDEVLPDEIKPYATEIEATDAVRQLTDRVVRGKVSAFDKAEALQAYFRTPANGFSYEEQTDTGSSPDALEDFLTNKRGFCEQYASAMGAMLRLAGVPSRVAVGFTAGEKQDDGSYLVTTDQAHAWPEAWFEGAGWIRFEPTPSTGGIRPPSYPAATPTTDTPGGTTTPTATAAPTDPDPAAETPEERRERLLAEREATPGATSSSSDGGGVPVRALGLGVLVLLVLGSPGLTHLVRRRRRWRTPTAQAAWTQLREDATDAGHSWQPALTPRAAAARLVREARLPAPAQAAVARVTDAVERERYARPGSPPAAGLPEDSAVVRKALRARLTRPERLRAVLLPASTLRVTSARLGSRTADLLDVVDDTAGAVRSRIRRR